MSDYAFKEIYTNPTLLNYTFDIDGAHKAETERLLGNYTTKINPGTRYGSVDMLNQTMEKVKQMVYVTGGMLSLLIGCIGLINFINIITTNVIIRQHEFALIESVGMTKKQLRQLMVYEGEYYAILSGCIGIVISFVLSITLLSKILSGPSFWFFTLHVTLVPVFIAIVIMLSVSIIVPIFSLRIFNRNSVVERLRRTA